jgi:AcrR family transcriptional regulator
MSRWQPDARARLQEAALALYGERGYEQTTVAEIAERAGLTKRTFFRYFADKREVLFWGSEVLEQQMVAAVEAAPASASTLAVIGAALAAAAARFEEFREFAGLRYWLVASSRELQERELIKAASLAAGLSRALRARGLGDTAAALAARTCMIVMQVTLEQWIDDPARTPFQQIAQDALAQLREIASTGLDLPELEERPRVGEVGQDNVRAQAGQFRDRGSPGCHQRAPHADGAGAREVAPGIPDYPHAAQVRPPPRGRQAVERHLGHGGAIGRAVPVSAEVELDGRDQAARFQLVPGDGGNVAGDDRLPDACFRQLGDQRVDAWIGAGLRAELAEPLADEALKRFQYLGHAGRRRPDGRQQHVRDLGVESPAIVSPGRRRPDAGHLGHGVEECLRRHPARTHKRAVDIPQHRGRGHCGHRGRHWVTPHVDPLDHCRRHSAR